MCRAKITVLSSSQVRTVAQTDLLLKMRIKLHQDLFDWRKLQYGYCPSLNDCIDAVDPNTPELANLFLPSSFQGSSDHEMTELAKLEYELQLGQAYDALDEVRTKIKIFNFNLDFKKNNVFSQRPNTRVQQYLKTLSADKINAADKYRQARQALLNLGLSKNDQSLRPLHHHELWGKDTSHLARLGDTKKEEPWFWTVGMPNGLSEAEQTEWSVECEQNFTLPHVFLAESQQSYQEDKDSWGIPGIPTRKTRNPGEFLEFLPGRPGILVNSLPSYQEDQDSW